MIEYQEFTPQYMEAQNTMNSRRAKTEQSKLVKQTLYFLTGAVFVSLLSFFFIIPGVIRFIGGFSGDSNTQQQTGVAPQIPILSAPAPATPSASITLQGFTTKNAEVIILKNGTEAQKSTADGEGKFTAAVPLDKGENIFTLYAKNGELESEVSQEYKTIFDNEAPLLEISEPTEGQSVQGKKNQNITVKGKTDQDTKVMLNDRLVFTSADGTFTTTHRLENGSNTLTFKAQDQAGNITEKKVQVTFAQ